jgi:hypothetical protein
MLHRYNGILLSHKRMKFVFPDKMNGARDHYASEINQKQKDSHHMISLICGIYKNLIL